MLLRRRARRRSEIASLYQPLSAYENASYRDAQGRLHAFAPASAAAGGIALTGEDELSAPSNRNDVWDDEVDDGELAHAFALTDDDDIV